MSRPRSTEAHDKVVHTALVLFGERGIDATSMDAIARASGVNPLASNDDRSRKRCPIGGSLPESW